MKTQKRTEGFMSRRGKATATAAALLGIVATGSQAHAAYVITLQDLGSDVVATGSGTINTAGLTPDPDFFTGQSTSASMSPEGPWLAVGPTSATPANVYDGISGPYSFGTNYSYPDATSGSGDIVLMYYASRLYVPQGYVSGAALSSTSTYANQTLATLGVTPGTYTWTWGAGPNADSLTLEAGSPVPEPASLGMLGLGAIALLARRRRIA